MPFPEEDLVVGPNGVATLDRRSNPRCDDPKAFTKSGMHLNLLQQLSLSRKLSACREKFDLCDASPVSV